MMTTFDISDYDYLVTFNPIFEANRTIKFENSNKEQINGNFHWSNYHVTMTLSDFLPTAVILAAADY